jgi:UDP:flavonoid glycosyltransferase YjiC (YdhE family)
MSEHGRTAVLDCDPGGPAFSPELVAAEVGELLSDTPYRAAAQHVRDEIATMLAPAEVVLLLVELADN